MLKRSKLAGAILSIAMTIAAVPASAESSVEFAAPVSQIPIWFDTHYNNGFLPHEVLSPDGGHDHTEEFIALLNEEKARSRLDALGSVVSRPAISESVEPRPIIYFHGFITPLEGERYLKIGSAQHFYDIGKVNQGGQIYDPRFDRIIEGSTVEGANLFMRADIHWRNVFSGE
ncbi:MAG: hypothetical protein AAF950_17045 [Pseudomonadota bacterium]